MKLADATEALDLCNREIADANSADLPLVEERLHRCAVSSIDTSGSGQWT
jgi:hypothetical protein